MTTTSATPLTPVLLAPDETVTAPGGRSVRATAKALGCLPRVRTRLLTLAREGGTTTYGELVRDLALPYPAVGVGRLLDLLAVDAERRGEPSLDVLVHGARGPGSDEARAAIERVHRHHGVP